MLIEKDNKLVVTSSIGRSTLLIIASIIMTIICIMGSSADDIGIFEKIAAIIGIPLFGFGTIYLIYRITSKKELVIVDKNGITDNTSTASIGFIQWNDISNIEIKSTETQKFDGLLTPQTKKAIENQKFISLTINNEEKYLEQIPQRKRTLLLSNNEGGLGIVNINLIGTGVDIYEFYEKIIKYREINGINFPK